MNYQELYNGFNNREDIARNFQIDEKDLEDIFIVYAEYDIGDYCGDAHVLFIRGGKLFEVHGSHCSCYGLEGQWSEEETFPEAAIRNESFAHLQMLKDMVKDEFILKGLNMNKMWTTDDDEKLKELLARKEAAEVYARDVRARSTEYLMTFAKSSNVDGHLVQRELVENLVENLEEVISELLKIRA